MRRRTPPGRTQSGRVTRFVSGPRDREPRRSVATSLLPLLPTRENLTQLVESTEPARRDERRRRATADAEGYETGEGAAHNHGYGFMRAVR